MTQPFKPLTHPSLEELGDFSEIARQPFSVENFSLAMDQLETWTTQQKVSFAYFMAGYNPSVVLAWAAAYGPTSRAGELHGWTSVTADAVQGASAGIGIGTPADGQ